MKTQISQFNRTEKPKNRIIGVICVCFQIITFATKKKLLTWPNYSLAILIVICF